MANDLKSLDPRAFLAIGEKRGKRIAAATADTPRYDLAANRLARKLHPGSQQVLISGKRKMGRRVTVLTLSPDPARGTEELAYFQAGQYISVSVPVGGYIHSRPYSLTSSPRSAGLGFYEIAVEEIEGGLVSRALSELEVGTALTVSEPMGFFTYEPLRDSREVVAIAGGSGVTPFVSLARAIADGIEDCSLTLLYGCNKKCDLLFENELRELAASEKIKVAFVLSGENAEGYESGFITADMIRKYAGEGDITLFVCGPRAIHDHIDGLSAELSLSARRLRHETYGEAPSLEGGAVKITVRSADTERVIDGNTGMTLLRALEWAGIPARSACRSGECGYCRARLLSGEVHIPEESDRRRLADEPHGYIHPCCTYPKTDLVIEVGKA